MPESDYQGLRQLLLEQLRELQPGDRYYVRLWRAYQPTGLLVFEGRLPLHVQRTERKGKLLSVLLSTPGEWAEYLVYQVVPGEYADSDSMGNLMVEDWCMEVYGPDGQGAGWQPRSDYRADDYLRWDQESIRELKHCGELAEYDQKHPRAKYERGRLVI